MQTLLIFLIFLGPLVFFHELGHFLFARLFGVKVEVFSIGFGPKFFKKKLGDTEYAVSIIPLGGYVKMFGDNPLETDKLSDDEKKVAFTHKSKFAKFWIVFGGPLANFILAFVIYFTLILAGEKVPEARLGLIKKDSIYYSMGLRTGDVIKEINSTEILGFDDLNLIDSNIKTISVLRNNKNVDLDVDINSQKFVGSLGEILSTTRAPLYVIGGTDFYYLFDQNDTRNLKSLEQIKEMLSGRSLFLYKVTSSELKKINELEFEKDDFIEIKNVSSNNFNSKMKEVNAYPSELAVQNVNSGPAANSGLKKGDVFISIEKNEINTFADVQKYTQIGKGERALNYSIKRGNEILNLLIKPEYKNSVARIGVQSSIVPFSMGLIESKSVGFFIGFKKAILRTKEGIFKTLVGFKKLLFGEVSMKNLGGPFAIASVAKDSFDISLSMFFRLMALISINLGLINLFPIPVLDGGHIVMLGIETVYGGPLPKKVLMRIQQVGVSLLFLLMFVAIFNDISRFF